MKPTWVRWRLVSLLVVASFVAYLLRTNMSVAGESMMTDLGLTKVQLGQVLAAFAWGYGLFQIPGGIFGDKAGGRRALTLMALAWCLLNLLVGLMPPTGVGQILLMLIALRFLMGAAQAAFFPVYGGLVFHWFPPSGWALPNAMGNFGLTVGAAAAGPLIAWLAQILGWRQSFILTSPLALLMAAVWWWYGRDRPELHAGVNAEELAVIDEGRPAPELSGQEHGESLTWRQVLADRNILLISLSYFCSNYVFYFFFNWLYIYLVDVRGLSQLGGGWFSSAPWLTGAVGAVIGGWLCDHLTLRIGIRRATRWPCLIGLLLTAVLLLAGAAASNAYVAVTFLSLCLGVQQVTEGGFWAATIAVAGKHASTGCGVLNCGGNLVGGVGAMLVPVVAERWGWLAALGSASGVAVAGALLWLWIRADQPIDAIRSRPHQA